MKTGRDAFTLLEALIALSLVTVLMALSWSLLSTFSRLENRARKTVAGLEITRSLRRQLHNDLDQIFATPNSAESDPSASLLTTDAQANLDVDAIEIAEEVLELEPSRLQQKIEAATEELPTRRLQALPSKTFFQGSRDSISFLVRRPDSTGLFEPREEFFVVTYEWRIHSDEVTGKGDTRIPEMEFSPEDQDEIEASATRRQFVRSVMTFRDFQSRPVDTSDQDSEAPALDFETIEIGAAEDGDVQGSLSVKELLDWMPEVSSIRFRFFDGRSWTSSWNRSELPIAVEAVLSIETEATNAESNTGKDAEDEWEAGAEIEIGDVESALPELDDNLDLGDEDERDFDPESKRILIRLGAHFSRRASGGELDDFEQGKPETFLGESK